MLQLIPSSRSLHRVRRAARATTAALLATAALQAAATSGALAQSAPGCQFQPDLAQVRSQIGAELVGDCLQNETAVPATGDRFQPTTGGLLIWSAAGWAAFTDGQTTWIDRAGKLATAGSSGPPPVAQPPVVPSTTPPSPIGQPAALPLGPHTP